MHNAKLVLAELLTWTRYLMAALAYGLEALACLMDWLIDLLAKLSGRLRT